jgi:hypothetical protein
MRFQIGDIVEHLLSKDWLLVLLYEPISNRYLCRMKNHNQEWFYDFELVGKRT